MNKFLALSISAVISVLIILAGFFAWFSMSFSACFGNNCAGTDIETLLPYVVLFMSVIIAPQAGYIFYKAKTDQQQRTFKWSKIITSIIFILALGSALVASPIQNRIQTNNRIRNLENISFAVYTNTMDDSNKFTYLTESGHAYPHYTSIYKTAEGEIEVTGGEFSPILRGVIGEPPCMLLEASSYLTPGSKNRSGFYRSEEKEAGECMLINGMYVTSVFSPYDSRIF